MSENTRHGVFASVAKKKVKEGEKKPAVAEYEDGEKAFPSPSTGQRASETTGKASAAPSPKVLGAVYDEVSPELVRTWRLKDRTIAELEDDPRYQELIDSVRVKGVLEPIIVRRLSPEVGSKHLYEEVAGFKRLTAAKNIGVNVPIVIREISDEEALSIQADENKGRSDPSAWSRGLHYARLIESEVYKTQSQLAASLNLERSTVSNLIRVASGMPEDVTKSLKLHRFGSTSLIHLLKRINEAPLNKRDDFIDRLVEHADEFNDKPDKALSIIDRAWAGLFSRDQQKKIKPQVFQSQKGKALSIKSGGDSVALTLHSAALQVASEDELRSLITDFLTEKGLSLEEKTQK